jgi:2-amino-4-hydroxy-6-hydroxymethyldihydropteridine diphosphokinase
MDGTVEVVLHFGSNVGGREKILNDAIHSLGSFGILKKTSSIYRSEPWGVKDQDDFLNMAVILQTWLSPAEVFEACQKIERKYPIVKNTQWGPRYLDIDIIFYADHIYYAQNLKIPHPRLHERNFVLIPLLEIMPDKVHPVLNKTIEGLFIECQDPSEVYLTDNILI